MINLNIYKLLEAVYERGYNAGDGFKQDGLLSDFLNAQHQAITTYYQEASPSKEGIKKLRGGDDE